MLAVHAVKLLGRHAHVFGDRLNGAHRGLRLYQPRAHGIGQHPRALQLHCQRVAQLYLCGFKHLVSAHVGRRTGRGDKHQHPAAARFHLRQKELSQQ
ncbi:hypothetical protein SDC9_120534 [bioreactor metagenome]|uniref:Uncharacterized protein n=1 Tax=bioreactor metagenome TaxID=1076179 RepID=A0A645C783_9ZZZZ